MATPLVLISGFLGAGKTTFLRRLLPLLKGRQPHLVINDYGQAEIDAASLAELAATVQAINGSCVCCESQGEFLNALATAGLTPHAVMLVETNGTSDPFEIIEAIGLDSRSGRYEPPLHVSVIDVQRWQKRWWHNALERLQVRSSGYHFLSKVDLVKAERRTEVARALHQVNPKAREISPELLVARLDAIAGGTPSSAPAVPSPELEAHESTRLHSEDHQHAHDFVSLQLDLPATMLREQMGAWLRALPREVVRAKGFVRLEDGKLHSFQKVEDDEEIVFLPLASAFARAPLALLIGTGLRRETIPPF